MTGSRAINNNATRNIYHPQSDWVDLNLPRLGRWSTTPSEPTQRKMDVPGIALITGAASGIGRACAQAFAKEDCSGIALLDLNLDALETLKAELTTLRPSNLHLEIYSVDVSNEIQVDRAVTSAVEAFGRIDYVVNAAGIAIKHPGGVAFAATQDWQRVLDINLNGTFFVLRAAARIMLEQTPIRSSIDNRPLQRGSIVNISSIQGVVGITLSTAYTTSKHAIMGLTRTASEDYADRGLRVNAVLPGYTETPLTMGNPDVYRAMQDRIQSAVPMKRMGRPEEIADGILFLAGGRSSFVTGSGLVVDGGYTSR